MSREYGLVKVKSEAAITSSITSCLRAFKHAIVMLLTAAW